MTSHPVVSPSEFRAAREKFLVQEKEFTRQRDALSAARRELPWTRVEKDYVFEGADGPVRLTDLFDGRRQLAVYHFMFGPDWDAGCKSCSYFIDHVDRIAVHLEHRDTTLVLVSRGPVEKLEAYRQRMGWHMRWVSSGANDFNFDFHVSATEADKERGKMEYNFAETPVEEDNEEMPGMSIFFKGDDGEIFHTYSAYARGLDPMLSTYQILDLTPKGRDEPDQIMGWLRRHDEYAVAGRSGAH